MKQKSATTKEKRKAFLAAFVKARGNVTRACSAANIGRVTFYRWRETSPAFRRELDDARNEYLDALESVLIRMVEKDKTPSIVRYWADNQLRGRGYGQPLPAGQDKAVADVLNRVLSGDTAPQAAAIEIDLLGQPLPEGLKLLLSRDMAVGGESGNEEFGVTEDELEQLYADETQKVELQESEFVPQRREEIKRIHEEVKEQDSFSPQAIAKKDMAKEGSC